MAIDTPERTRLRRAVLESRRLTSTAARLRSDSTHTCGQARSLRSSVPAFARANGTVVYDLGERGSSRHVYSSLEGDLTAPGHARRVLGEHVRDRVPEEVLETLELLVTELVTNGLVHGGAAGAAITLHVHVCDRMVRVQVTDPGAGFDPKSALRPPGPGGGWGLLMVGQLSDAWGASHEQGRAKVWLRLRF
jgi:anti-sigma regulatory factor (Ser/Thr protein kinase)